MADRRAAGLPFPLQVILVLALMLLGWRILTLGMADATARLNPEQALQWRLHHPAALYQLSERQVAKTETHGVARENAIASLRANPFNGRAYRLLAQIADNEKKRSLAYEFYQKAELYDPRDLETHAWLLNHALLNNDAVAAVHQIDNLLRLQDGLQTQLMPVIAGLATLQGSQKILIAALNTNPSWRLPVVRGLLMQEKAAEHYAGFFNLLTQSSNGVSAAEQQLWLSALNQGKQWPLAYLSWAVNLPATNQRELGNIFNGGFEFELLDSAFDWRFEQVPGATADRAFREGAKGQKALRVSFDDRRVVFNHVKQTLVLNAGRYKFTGQGLTANLKTERGLVWTIQCLDSGEQLAESGPWQGDAKDWQMFSVEFDVPADKCAAQSLTLKLPARVPSEEHISGAIWFDDLRIQRIQRLTEAGVQ